MQSFSSPTLNCLTSVEANSSYLATVNAPHIANVPDSGSIGLMMILSTFQYYPTANNPTYSNAIGQASKAAFIQSGGQGVQDKLASKALDVAKDSFHYLGITDGQLGTVFGAAKVIRDRQINTPGPNIYNINTHLTISQTGGSIGLGWKFK